MKPDCDSLTKAGLGQEEIVKISECEDQEMQIRMLRKCRYIPSHFYGERDERNKKSGGF